MLTLHEAVCLNALQTRLFFFDDFQGMQLKDEWNLAVQGTGTGAVVDQQDGGIYRLIAPVANDSAWIAWNSIRSLLVSLRVTMEVRAKANSTSNINLQIQLRFGANERIMFQASNGGNWFLYCRTAAGTTNLDSGIAQDTDYHRFRIECHTHDGNHVHFYIDGVQCANSPVSTNITAFHLEPYLRLNSLAAAVAEKQLDIDYVYTRQDRGHGAMGTDALLFHEAYCLDSQQLGLYWSDDFLGDQIQDEWNSAGDAGGSAAVVDQEDGGIVQLTTGNAVNDDWNLNWNAIRTLLASNRATLEARVKVSATANTVVRIRLYEDMNDRISFVLSGGVWYIICSSGGVSSTYDSGATPDTSYHIFRIECHTHDGTHVHFYIDGDECDNSPITSNVPTVYLQPWLYILTSEVVAKMLDVDYVGVRQDR